MVFTLLRDKRNNAVYKSIKEFDLDVKTSDAELKDELIVVEKDQKSAELIRVAYWDAGKSIVFEFITNNLEISSDRVADINKHRWQIEIMLNAKNRTSP